MKFTKTVGAIAVIGGIVMSGSVFADEYITNAAEIVKKANWKTMETVKVIMGERGDKLFYRPSDLVFKEGQPYKLQIVNKGKKKHYFTATKFFKSIATRKVQSNKDGEIKAPYFKALELMAKGGQLDLYFVPVTTGTFEVFCTIDDHKKRGMVGSLTVK